MNACEWKALFCNLCHIMADFIFLGRGWWPKASILSSGGKQEKEIIAGRKGREVEKWRG